MLELEKKHWTEYRKEKKEIKMYDNITKENKNKFYKVLAVFHFMCDGYIQRNKKVVQYKCLR